MKDFIKEHVISTGMTVASALVVMQMILPGVFDFVFDLALLGIIYAVGKAKAYAVGKAKAA